MALVLFIFRFYVVGEEDPVLIFWILFVVPSSCGGLVVAGGFRWSRLLSCLVCDRRIVGAKPG